MRNGSRNLQTPDGSCLGFTCCCSCTSSALWGVILLSIGPLATCRMFAHGVAEVGEP